MGATGSILVLLLVVVGLFIPFKGSRPAIRRATARELVFKDISIVASFHLSDTYNDSLFKTKTLVLRRVLAALGVGVDETALRGRGFT